MAASASTVASNLPAMILDMVKLSPEIGPANIDTGQAHECPVFRNRAPRHAQALLREQARELSIGERRARILRGDELLHDRAHRGCRGGAAAFGGKPPGEEMLEL